MSDDIYNKSLLTKVIYLPVSELTGDVEQKLLTKIVDETEGKCIEQGYVKINSVKIISHSNGLIIGEKIKINLVYECLTCCPLEGETIYCIAKNITKAGVRAETEHEISPLVIFIARDHHYNLEHFTDVKEGDKIKVKIIGHRYELYDEYVSVIAELLKPEKE
tara:strand:- start:22857 stop:23345 length:489 start_codon:yes stop_codon:yes gene_type:complete